MNWFGNIVRLGGIFVFDGKFDNIKFPNSYSFIT